MKIGGLVIGGKIRRDMAAYTVHVPLLGFHSPTRQTWSWVIEFYRYSLASGCKHRFRAINLGDFQRRTIIDVGFGSLQLIRQKHSTPETV